MLSLGDLFIVLLFIAAAAWLWRAHGIRERALERVKQHCAREEVELLDENVALRRLRFVRDAGGRRRLARVYGFEFTVTGEQRHAGSICMFGQQAGHIEMDPYPFRAPPVDDGRVIQIDAWRRSHPKPEERRQAD
ncbi:DUF3301 domain-containing protein [Pseudomonas sp. RIT-PI-AD]|uniref:DUF3301 domain-containing protein n=1 Tax=Pseudomonas sp. RIT-PI-AD TaxID=3035294 RepID=UPI0021D86B67|nr:DUF3301 domain-containing protein [Pseudomonas sp. RIT-PI-AD]